MNEEIRAVPFASLKSSSLAEEIAALATGPVRGTPRPVDGPVIVCSTAQYYEWLTRNTGYVAMFKDGPPDPKRVIEDAAFIRMHEAAHRLPTWPIPGIDPDEDARLIAQAKATVESWGEPKSIFDMAEHKRFE